MKNSLRLWHYGLLGTMAIGPWLFHKSHGIIMLQNLKLWASCDNIVLIDNVYDHDWLSSGMTIHANLSLLLYFYNLLWSWLTTYNYMIVIDFHLIDHACNHVLKMLSDWNYNKTVKLYISCSSDTYYLFECMRMWDFNK